MDTTGRGAAQPSLHERVRQRREALHGHGPELSPDDPLWGLALSGGGIRSATFALGLCSGLARRGIFSRFDLLSTVSGGGYAGSAIGKLYDHPDANPGHIERELGDMPGSWFVWWLRATSRYLTPRGAQDLLFALTLYARNLFAVHTELAVVCIAAGALLALGNLGLWALLFLLFSAQPRLLQDIGWLFAPWMSSYWLFLAVPAAASVPLASAYWTIPSRPGARGFNEGLLTALLLALSALGILVAVALPGLAPQRDGTLRLTCFVVGAALGLAGLGPWVARLARGALPTGAAAQRNRLTNWLMATVTAAIALAAAGALDRLAWWLVFGDHAALMQWLPAVIAAGIALARALAAQVPTRDQASATSSRFGFLVAQSAGWLLFALLLVFWVSVAYKLGLSSLFGSPPLAELQFGAAAGILAALVGVPLVYLVITGRNEDFANLSSLHMFYRARLTRSFLGAANRERFGHSPLDRVDGDAVSVSQKPKVYDVVASDTVRLADYAPHRRGGPVHVLNATINQTQAALGGLFNQDRKGQYLSVSSGGLSRVGLGPWQQREDIAQSELPAWMAISGAAFAPGLGGQTSTGLALLLFIAGVRLGYWWDMAAQQPQGAFVKYRLLLDEARAKFRGAEFRYRYLSDGGHFENTAAWTLLRERARLVVLSDAGADPDYAHADLENLVRKARIDLLAQVRFLGEAELEQLGLAAFGSLDQLRDPQSDACIALARVDYADDPAQPGANRFGWIVYVKPNLFSGMPVDLRNYARDHRPFPQEPTTDQFFSESQWESYFMLGRELGLQLDRAALERLAHIAPDSLQAGRPAPAREDAPDAQAGAPAKPAARLGPRAAILATSGLSITAVIAIATATWQAWSKYADDRAERARRYDSEVATAEALFERWVAGHPELFPEIASSLASIATGACRDGVNAVHPAPQMKQVFDRVAARCSRGDDQPLTPACAVVADPKTSACMVGAERALDAPTYWAVDYSDRHAAQQRLAIRPASAPPEVTYTAKATPPEATAAPPVVVAAAIPRAAAPAPANGPAPASGPAPANAPATASVPEPVTPSPASATKAGTRPRAVPPKAATTSAATPSAATAATAPGAATASSCQGKRVYIQVYSPQDRPLADRWSRELAALGARVPKVEDVTETAERNYRPAPRPVSGLTLVWHTPDEARCAGELQAAHRDDGLRARPLTPGLTPTPGVLELWIPPPR